MGDTVIGVASGFEIAEATGLPHSRQNCAVGESAAPQWGQVDWVGNTAAGVGVRD
jgi:hypothetical protein